MNKDHIFRKSDDEQPESEGKAITLHVGGETAIIPTAEIVYVESDDNRIRIITTTNVYSVRMTIRDIQTSLPQPCYR